MFKRILLAGVCPALLLLSSCRKNDTAHPRLQYHVDGEVAQLLRSDIPTAVNVVIVGDGYRRDDLVANGEFDAKANLVTDYLFNTAPYSTYKDYFNVYKVYAESAGKNDGAKFSSYTNATLTVTNANTDLIKAYAKKAVPGGTANIIILLANSDEPDNGGIGNISMITSSPNSLSLLLHRLGHNFGQLGDEYISPETYATVNKNLLKSYPNLDVTADPTKVKWASYLKNTAYKSAIGVYEGGFYVAKGVYRPEGNSVMLNASTCSSYNAPSREAIARLIFQITGVPFNMSDFLEKDRSAIQARTISTPAIINPATDFPAGVSN